MNERAKEKSNGNRGQGRETVFAEGIVRHPVRSVVIGTGFIALDIVFAEGRTSSVGMWAGGTCGNVLAILAYLGWRSYPVASLGKDSAAEFVVEDMARFGVNSRFVNRDSERRTPVVVEKIRTLPGRTPRSRFVWTCLACGTWFPNYRPVLVKDAQIVAERMPDPAVFFFDRVSRGALDLARSSAERGALVVFEPSGVGDEKLFQEALKVSHVLKYSNERLAGMRDKLEGSAALLEVETLGDKGLRYRLRTDSSSAQWKQLHAYEVAEVKDTVGAGDWCTAGLVHAIGAGGLRGLRKASDDEVEGALRLGQALAAFACAYEGARGGMYAVGKRRFQSLVRHILNGEPFRDHPGQVTDNSRGRLWESVCPACETASRNAL